MLRFVSLRDDIRGPRKIEKMFAIFNVLKINILRTKSLENTSERLTFTRNFPTTISLNTDLVQKS